MPRRFYVAHLWAAMIMLLAAVAVACSGEEPTAASAPTQAPTAAPSATPTPTASPTPVPTVTPSPTPDPPVSLGVEFWELDRSSTGRDLAALLTDEEVSCLRNELGASYQAMLEAPLIGEAGELLEGGGIGPSPQVPCLTPEHQISASLSVFSVAAGGLSAGSQDCIVQLLIDRYPAVAEGRGLIDDGQGPVMLRFIACLTPEEAAALTPFVPGPVPNPNDIACLIQELEDTSSGERIIAVLSGADASGEGLTMKESAELGQAVEACGIETEFGFPSL